MQIISFDFGTKKIGVAVGQTLTKTSSPLSIIFNHRNKINWPEIEEVLNEWKPELILVGKPLNNKIFHKYHLMLQKHLLNNRS